MGMEPWILLAGNMNGAAILWKHDGSVELRGAGATDLLADFLSQSKRSGPAGEEAISASEELLLEAARMRAFIDSLRPDEREFVDVPYEGERPIQKLAPHLVERMRTILPPLGE